MISTPENTQQLVEQVRNYVFENPSDFGGDSALANLPDQVVGTAQEGQYPEPPLRSPQPLALPEDECEDGAQPIESFDSEFEDIDDLCTGLTPLPDDLFEISPPAWYRAIHDRNHAQSEKEDSEGVERLEEMPPRRSHRQRTIRRVSSSPPPEA
ncbi:Hypothetical protein D9617_52g060370 [Elsinoe fawcettii]|nr:Hypothetical protein D9617_52g060370 [Elsinoe fawcettii]